VTASALLHQRAWWGAQFHMRAVRAHLDRRLPPALATPAQRFYHRVMRPAHAGWRGYTRADFPYGDVVTIDGIRLRLHDSLSIRNAWRIVSGMHTRSERRLVLGVLRPDDVVMELGGGIGMLSTACALKIGSDRVFSFEANPQLEPLIQDNYALNGVKSEMTMCLLGPEPGVSSFHISANFSDSSVFRDSPSDYEATVEVPIRSLNDEIGRISPTFLIVDIEGAEIELMPYADLSGVRKMVVEYHPSVNGAAKANALRRRLRRQGFVECDRAGTCILYTRPAA